MTPKEILSGPEGLLKACDDASWRELVRFLLSTISDWLGYEVKTEPIEKASVGKGFCVPILHASPSGSDFFYWRGILGASIIEGQLLVTLYVFMYSGDQRLMTKSGYEYAEYYFIANEGRWVLQGWFNDEFGEFEMF